MPYKKNWLNTIISPLLRKDNNFKKCRVRWFNTVMIPIKESLTYKCAREACEEKALYTIYGNSLLHGYIGRTLTNYYYGSLKIALCSKNCLEDLILKGMFNGSVPIEFGVKIKQIDTIFSQMRGEKNGPEKGTIRK